MSLERLHLFLFLKQSGYQHYYWQVPSEVQLCSIYTHSTHTRLRPPPKKNTGSIWTQSLVTNFLSFNARQYQSNHCKQDFLITTNKISHCLLQPQIINPLNIPSYQPTVTNSMHSRSNHPPSPHFQSTFSIIFSNSQKILRGRIFLPLGSLMEIMNSSCLLIPLINTRNEKTKSWTYPKSLHKTRNKKMRFQLAWNKTFCSTPSPLTYRQLMPSKIKKKIKAFCIFPPSIFNSKYSISGLKSKHLFVCCRKPTQTASLELLRLNR